MWWHRSLAAATAHVVVAVKYDTWVRCMDKHEVVPLAKSWPLQKWQEAPWRESQAPWRRPSGLLPPRPPPPPPGHCRLPAPPLPPCRWHHTLPPPPPCPHIQSRSLADIVEEAHQRSVAQDKLNAELGATRATTPKAGMWMLRTYNRLQVNSPDYWLRKWKDDDCQQDLYMELKKAVENHTLPDPRPAIPHTVQGPHAESLWEFGRLRKKQK